MWVRPGIRASPSTQIAEQVDGLAAAGFTTLFVKAMDNGRALWPSITATPADGASSFDAFGAYVEAEPAELRPTRPTR